MGKYSYEILKDLESKIDDERDLLELLETLKDGVLHDRDFIARKIEKTNHPYEAFDKEDYDWVKHNGRYVILEKIDFILEDDNIRYFCQKELED